MFDFNKKTVMVTGAVRNTGVGIAEAFAAAGARVIVNGRRAEDAKRIAEKISAAYDTEVIEAVMDITKPEQVNKFFDSLEERQISLDVLVNNAVYQALGFSFMETPYEVFQEAFAVNVLGLCHCSQRAAKMMMERGKGSIINVGSNTASRSLKNRSAYIASKGAVDALTRAMAVDLASHNIRVNTVAPGYISSERWNTLDQECIDRRRKNIPLGRECQADDVAQSVMFLASDLSRCTTGGHLVIDGGCTVQLFPEDCDC
jgi:NAD(P)-dependent dehydrogenase (short-subunit alcohol dehydrogenase family)